jgi:hypothetical protein
MSLEDTLQQRYMVVAQKEGAIARAITEQRSVNSLFELAARQVAINQTKIFGNFERMSEILPTVVIEKMVYVLAALQLIDILDGRSNFLQITSKQFQGKSMNWEARMLLEAAYGLY